MSGFNLSELSVRQRSVTLFLLVVLALSGFWAFSKLGRAEDPSFTIKTMTVVTVWPGATAREMQDQVAEPLEKRMQELRWYDRTETYTRPGIAVMAVTLKDQMDPRELPEQFYQARKKLGDEALRLPKGVAGPFINDEYGDVDFALYALKARGEPMRVLARQAEELRQRLLRVAGVKKVDIIGERPERIYVEFDFARLANLGVTPQQIFSALNDANVVQTAGAVETRGPQVQVRLDGAFDDLERIRETPVVAGGRTTRLADLATVRRGYEDPASFLVRSQGEPAIELGVVMKDGWNGLVLGPALDREVAAISRDLPLGLTLAKVSDQASNIREAYDEFMLKFFVALAVVVVVSLVSLGWRVGIVVALAVPLTLSGVFLVMYATGRALDRITLGALILSLGLLVDDAIIVIESMVVRMGEGYRRVDAACYTWGHTAAPMLAGTLVTVIGFTPIGFAQSGVGEYAGNIFWVVGFALLTSWLVAVVFTPYLGVTLLPDVPAVEGGGDAIYGTPTYERLRRLVAWVIANRRKVVAAVAALFVAALLLMGLVSKQFFPVADRREVMIEVQMPEGTSIAATEAKAAEVEAWLRRQPENQMMTTYVGQGAPRFFLGMSPELPDPSFAKIVVLTGTAEAREALKHRARVAIAAGLGAGAQVRATQIVFGPPLPWPVAIRVVGPDVREVRTIVERVRTRMLADPKLRMVHTDWGERAPAVHFVLDQERLRSFGLSSAEASRQLQFLLTGIGVTSVREDIRSVDVVARSAGRERLDPSRLGAFTLTGAQGQKVPLDQIGRAEIRMEDPILRRRDRLPTITLSADVGEEFTAPDVENAVMADLRPIVASLPEGYRIDAGSSVEENDKANVSLAAVFPMMLVMMMLVIIFQVRSMAALAMVLLTAPLALIGVAPTLLAFAQPFGFTAILGVIGLAGIVMRNTLILIGQIHTNEAAGLDQYRAIVEATVQRARPVLLTALAAVLAFIPLTFSVFWGSLAYTLIGGTLAGTLLTLVFLPALYAIWFRVRPPVPGDARPDGGTSPAASPA